MADLVLHDSEHADADEEEDGHGEVELGLCLAHMARVRDASVRTVAVRADLGRGGGRE